jgi:hypothetical protein
MTDNRQYAGIGHFKGVPDAARLQASRKAGEAQSLATKAVLREAIDLGENPPDEDAVARPSVDALNAVWEPIEADTASSLRSALLDLRLAIIFPIAAALLGPLAAVLNPHHVYTTSLPIGTLVLTGFLIWLVTFFVLWAVIGREASAAVRSIREQGFLDEDLPRALSRVSGHAWLVGEKALYIARWDDKEVKTVFYDAIGLAKVSVRDDGREAVVVTARDGSVIARMTSPSFMGRDSARHLAERITELASRKV